MKQINNCPNCGALLPKSRTNTITCEYCDSEFVNPNPVIAVGEVDKERLKEEIDDFKTVRIMPFGVNDIPRFEDGTPVTSTTIKANYFTERDEKGRFRTIKLDAGHEQKRPCVTVETEPKLPKSEMQEVARIMQEVISERCGKKAEVEFAFDNAENQWKVRCFPW